MSLAPHQDFGPYTLIDQIAVGGMAEIYLAKTKGVAGFEKFLALKVIHPNYADDDQFIQMLIDEAKISVGLSHANICQIFDLGQHGETYYISMEFIDGYDLFKVMRRLSELNIDVPIECAVYIAQEICCGLDYAHRKRDISGQPLNIVHRDISPQNILLSRSGDVKIVDFGIAKAASRSRKTQAGVIKGKYFYMSPEQAWGDPIDHRTDIFSAGIILYEVLTGQMLYLEEDLHRLLDMVRKADIPRPSTRRPDIPPQLETIVMKALAKRPGDRWQSAHELQIALSNFLYGYAPDFTSERLAELVAHGMAEQGSEPAPSIALATEAGELPLLAARDDVPVDQHSVIFDINKLTDHDAYEEDRGEATRISGPPVGMLGSQALQPSASFDGGDTQADLANDPTQISDAPSAPARRASRAVPAEIVVPRPRAPEVLDGAPRRGDLTPTPIEAEPSQLAPLHLPEEDEDKTLPPELGRPRTASRAVPQRAAPPARPRRAAPSEGVRRPRLTGPLPPRRPQPPEDPTLAWEPPAQAQAFAPPVAEDYVAGDYPDERLTFARGGDEEQTWAPPPRSAPAPRPAVHPRPTRPSQGMASAAPPPPPPIPPQPPGGVPPQPPQPYGRAQAQAHTQPQPHAQLQPHALPQPHAQPYAPQPYGPQPHAQQPYAQAQPYAQQPYAQVQPYAQPRAPQPFPQPPASPHAPQPQYPFVQAPPSAFGQAVTTGEQMMPRRRRGLWLAVLVSLVLLGAAGVMAALVLWPISPQQPLIHVTSVPAGATVSLDGKQYPGVTPLQIAVPDAARTYRVRVTLKNHEPYDTIARPVGDPPQVQIVAPMNPLSGTLEIESTPANADIYINRELRGSTPQRLTGVSLGEDLVFEVSKRGYRTATQRVRWGGQTYHKVRITLHKSR